MDLNPNTSLQDAFTLVQKTRVLIQTDVHKLTGSTHQPDEQSIKEGNSFPDPAERRGTATSQRRRGRIATLELRSYIIRSAPVEQKKSRWTEPSSTTQRSEHVHVEMPSDPFNCWDGSVTSRRHQSLHWLLRM